jgi:hypothetical protein
MTQVSGATVANVASQSAIRQPEVLGELAGTPIVGEEAPKPFDSRFMVVRRGYFRRAANDS